ncbi:Flp pilus assembly protein CpaB [Aliivibrio wodanis]|uniref:SAF domain-containing protein n=1 Tax=Aliivibrio wodanis TaxID=80852 RepID=A0A5Q4Z4J8_9GAMM|nr:hypothetical protein AW0309160_02425 [Aliivibrio wodanis]
MSRMQLFLLFALSIILGLGAVFFAKQWMDTQVQPEVEVEVINRLPVIVAVQEIHVGTIIEEKHIAIKLLEESWKKEYQFDVVDELIGKVVTNPIYPDEIIHRSRLVNPGEGASLAALIPDHKRAVTIRVNDVIGVAGFLLPGNKVDVLNTVRSGKVNVQTSTILKDIKVLAVDQTAKTGDNTPVIVRAVTLEVSPKEAEKLLTANAKGEIQLALRNPHEPVEKVVRRKYVAPSSVTIIKGTQSTNIRVKD